MSKVSEPLNRQVSEVPVALPVAVLQELAFEELAALLRVQALPLARCAQSLRCRRYIARAPCGMGSQGTMWRRFTYELCTGNQAFCGFYGFNSAKKCPYSEGTVRRVDTNPTLSANLR